MESTPTKLCVTCGRFYGTGDKNFLCSMCFKKTNTSEPAKPAPVIETIIQQQPAAEPVKEVITETRKLADNPKRCDPERCKTCSRKLGMTGFQCRCGSVFCRLHRMPEYHDCVFDFKSFEREKLTQSNPTVIASKLDKI